MKKKLGKCRKQKTNFYLGSWFSSFNTNNSIKIWCTNAIGWWMDLMTKITLMALWWVILYSVWFNIACKFCINCLICVVQEHHTQETCRTAESTTEETSLMTTKSQTIFWGDLKSNLWKRAKNPSNKTFLTILQSLCLQKKIRRTTLNTTNVLFVTKSTPKATI